MWILLVICPKSTEMQGIRRMHKEQRVEIRFVYLLKAPCQEVSAS